MASAHDTSSKAPADNQQAVLAGREENSPYVRYGLFGNGNTGVEYVRAKAPRSKLAVTFSHVGSLDIRKPGYAENFLLERGFDVLTLKCNVNNWFQDISREQLRDAIAGRLPDYDFVVCYGSSMGGYAAIYFAEIVKANVVIALSPQYSIDPKIVDFDQRWAGSAAKITFKHQPLDAILAHTGAAIYVVYDPHNDDAKHAAAMQAASNRIIPVEIPYSGHPSGVALQQVGLLAGLFDSLVEGRIPPLRRDMRAQRTQSAQYLFGLAQSCVRHGHKAAALSLLERAVATDGAHVEIRMAYCHQLHAQGRVHEALAVLREYWPILPQNVHMISYRAHLEQVAGDPKEARRLFDLAIRQQPDMTLLYKEERKLLSDIVADSDHKMAMMQIALERAQAEAQMRMGGAPAQFSGRNVAVMAAASLAIVAFIAILAISLHVV